MKPLPKLSMALLAVALAVPSAAFAGTVTSSVTVSTSVSANCTINAATIAFPAYDPVVTNATSADTASGTLQYACTKGTAPRIDLNTGSNPTGSTSGTRSMSNGASTASYIGYDIYQDTGYATLWGTGTAGFIQPATPNKGPQIVTMYAKIPGGQDVPAGASYTDTVTATINF